MKTIPLRYLAEINPATPVFDQVPSDQEVGFLPLEAVWSDGRADHSRRAIKAEVSTGYTRYQPGDVVCPKVTPTFQAGRSMIVQTLGAGTTELHILRPRHGVDARWVAYAVRSKHFLDEGVTAFQGVAGLQRVPAEYLAGFKVIDVPPQEQRRIADFLDDRVAGIDRIIVARRSQLRAISEARLSSLDDVVRDAGPSQRLAWSLQLSAVGVVVNPSSYFQEDGVPFVHGYNVRDGYLDLADLKKMSASDSMALGRSRLRAADVLVVRAGYPGRAAVVPPELEGGNCASVLLLRPGPNLTSHWLAAFINSPIGKGQVEQAQYGAAQGVVNLSDVLSFSIPLPERYEQERRLGRLREIESQLQSGRKLIETQIGAMLEYKQSLITGAVTGELDVTTAGSGIPG